MKYLIDTNIVIEFLHNNEQIIQKIYDIGIDNCCMPEISLCELYYGVYNIEGTKYFVQEMNRLNTALEKFHILENKGNAELYGKIKARLKRIGQRVDEFDILIGSLAAANGLIVVTDNEKHFICMPDVKCENWLER